MNYPDANAAYASEECMWRQQEQELERRKHEEQGMLSNMKAGDGGGSFQNPQSGTTRAVCTQLIDLGTQPGSVKYPTPKRKLRVVWEVEERMGDGRPFIVMSTYTASANENAAFRLMLEKWRGRKYAVGEDMNPPGILGQPCMLSLVENGDYINIGSVSPMERGREPLVPVGPLVFFDIDKWDDAAFNQLSAKTQEKILQSPEAQQRTAPNPPAQEEPPPPDYEPVTAGDDLDDDIPF